MSRPATFDHLTSQKKPLERSVRIFLDDDPLVALSDARSEFAAAVSDEARAEAQAAIDTATQAVEDSSVTLLFRSIGRKRYDRLVTAFPASEEANEEYKKQFGGEAPYDADAFSAALIAASCVDPVMSEDQVRELRDSWNSSEYVELFTAALEVNTQRRVADLGKASG